MSETRELVKQTLPCAAVQLSDGRWTLLAADYSWGTPIYDERLIAFLNARSVSALSVLPHDARKQGDKD